MSRISSVRALEILDSRANPTLYVEVNTESGAMGWACAPSGASTGSREAVELRDGGKRFFGKGVTKCIAAVSEKVAPALRGRDVYQQQEIDSLLREIDGTGNFSNIGANTSTAVSVACARAAAKEQGVELYRYFGVGLLTLPTPMFNIINGGKHAGGGLAIQEFMLVPDAVSFQESLRIATEVYHSLKEVIKSAKGASAVNVGDEGGFAPPFRHTREALDAISSAVKAAGYSIGTDAYIAMDSAADSFFSSGKYSVDERELSASELLDYYEELVSEYPIISLEDPFEENDWDSFTELTSTIGRVRVVGDDLLVTRIQSLQKAIELKACTGVIVKVNQVGTLSDAVGVIRLAKARGVVPIVSHRSGETEDPFVAHLATGYSSGAIKTGAPARGERTVKYNELLKISAWDSDTNFKGCSVFRV